MKQDTLSDIERAIENVRLFSKQKEEAIDGSLEESVDILKVYTSAISHMQNGSEKEQELAKRMLEATKEYNEVVRLLKCPPESLSGILKQFFKKFAGYPEAKVRDEIILPVHIQFSTEDVETLSLHKITLQKEDASGKILSVLQSVQRASDTETIKPQERDLFYTKCLTLLLNQTEFPISIKEALHHIHNSEITSTLVEGAYLLHDTILQLEQSIKPFPGVEITLKGAFWRDSFHHDLTIPIKGSFTRTSTILHTGFPHPSQYIGFSLSDKLLPNCMLKIEMCPKFEKLITQKHKIACELATCGALYQKAKVLLNKKRALFTPNEKLFSLVKTLYQLEDVPRHYDELSTCLSKASKELIDTPIEHIQKEWLIQRNSNLALHPYDTYSYNHKLQKAACNIYLMQLSEHLGFKPRDLTLFERTLITSALRQQLIFIHELYELHEDNLQAHLQKTIEEEIALFTNTPSTDPHTQRAEELAEELFQYYCIRFEIK